MKQPLLLFLIFVNYCVFSGDVSYFGVIKSQHFRQTSATTVTVLPTNGYGFNAFVVASNVGLVTNASVKPSNQTPLRWLLPESDNTTWRFTEFFNTQSALDSAYPVGTIFSPINYTITMYTLNDGIKTSTLRFFLLLSPISMPVTAQIQNFDEAQAIDPSSDFTLQWNDLGGSTLDIVQVLIVDSVSNIVFMSPAPLQNGALNGTSRSITIPANTLPEATELEGHLIVARPGNPDTSYSGATGIPALAKDTAFRVATISLRPIIRYSKNRNSLLMSWDKTGFKLQQSADLLNWLDVPGNPQSMYQMSIPPIAGKLFFRLVKTQ
jgi:hypothetical protein